MVKVLKILNHQLTEDQITDLQNTIGAYELTDIEEVSPELKKSLLNSPNTAGELFKVAEKLSDIMFRYDYVILPGGSPALMWTVAMAFNSKIKNYRPYLLFSHTERQAIEIKQPDGTIMKKSVFKHIKWIVI